VNNQSPCLCIRRVARRRIERCSHMIAYRLSILFQADFEDNSGTVSILRECVLIMSSSSVGAPSGSLASATTLATPLWHLVRGVWAAQRRLDRPGALLLSLSNTRHVINALHTTQQICPALVWLHLPTARCLTGKSSASSEHSRYVFSDVRSERSADYYNTCGP